MIGGAENGSLASVSGGGVTTWARAAQSLSNADIEIWYGVSTGTSATIAIAFSAGSPLWLNVSDWRGLVGTLDHAAMASGGQASSASSASAGSITTTTAPDLVVFAIADEITATFGEPGPGSWSALTAIDDEPAQHEWFQVDNAAGAIDLSATVSTSKWDAAIAAFPIAL